MPGTLFVKKFRAWRERRRIAAQLSEADHRYEEHTQAITAERSASLREEADWRSEKAAILAENTRLAQQVKDMAVKLDRVTVNAIGFRSKLEQAVTREEALAQKISQIETQGFSDYMNALVSRSEAAQ